MQTMIYLLPWSSLNSSMGTKIEVWLTAGNQARPNWLGAWVHQYHFYLGPKNWLIWYISYGPCSRDLPMSYREPTNIFQRLTCRMQYQVSPGILGKEKHNHAHWVRVWSALVKLTHQGLSGMYSHVVQRQQFCLATAVWPYRHYWAKFFWGHRGTMPGSAQNSSIPRVSVVELPSTSTHGVKSYQCTRRPQQAPIQHRLYGQHYIHPLLWGAARKPWTSRTFQSGC